MNKMKGGPSNSRIAFNQSWQLDIVYFPVFLQRDILLPLVIRFSLTVPIIKKFSLKSSAGMTNRCQLECRY